MNVSPLAIKIIRISFLVQVLWQKEPVRHLIFQRISQLKIGVNLAVCALSYYNRHF